MTLRIKPVVFFCFIVMGMHAYAGMQCDTSITSNDTLVTCKVVNAKGELVRLKKYLNGERHGEQKEWHSNGKIRAIRKYSKGCPVDTVWTYYPSGNIESMIPYSECTAAGTRLLYYENGDTLSIREGELFRSFHENGILSQNERYNSSGQKHGLGETWREDGTRKDSTVYENGELIEIREYYPSGRLRYWAKYPGGRLKWANYYTPEGKPSGEIRNGSGKCVLYSENGEIRVFREYRDGKEVSSRMLDPGEDPELP